MTNVKIICPNCGKDFYVIDKDINKNDLRYHCNVCNSDFDISFFDRCPQCNENVGFFDSGGFSKDMKSIGTDILSAINNPWSLVDNLGVPFVDAFLHDVKNANGDGICPICKKRYIRCGNCYSMIPVSMNATFKDSYKCNNCKVIVSPNGIVDNKASFHSMDFRRHLVLDKKGKLDNNKKQQPLNTPSQNCIYTSKKYTEKELFRIIAISSNSAYIMDRVSGMTEIGCSKPKLRKNLKNHYDIDIPMKVMNSVKTYGELAKVIISNTGTVATNKQVNEDTISQSNETKKVFKTVSHDNDLNLSIAKGENFSSNEIEYINELKELLSDGNISPKERNLLDKIRIYLGISEQRAAELEGSLLTPKFTPEEMEYIDMYREVIESGDISAKERKLLDKILKLNGISQERAKELEATIKT